MFNNLHNEFTRRYEDFYIISKDLQLVSLPFTFNINDARPCVQLELINLQARSILKYKFYQKTITKFYTFLNLKMFKNIFDNTQKYSLDNHTSAKLHFLL